jgi:hypothetical protein
MNKKLNLYLLQLIAAGLLASWASVAPAQVYINEIFFNPPNPPFGEDSTREYIELRGQPNMSLANHYLIFLDSPMGNGFGSAGKIEQIFNLGSSTDCPNCTLGSLGYLTLRQKGSLYAVPSVGSTNLMNHGTGAGFGAGTSGATSTIGASDKNTADGVSNGEIESGFTAMLIRTDGVAIRAPALGQDLDVGNNGLDPAATDVNDWRDHWTILDSVGVSEPAVGGQGGAYDDRFYAPIHFGTEVDDESNFVLSEHCTGCQYVSLGANFEGEYVARWGNSTGQTAADWHVVDTTDDLGSGYQSTLTDPNQQPSQPNAWGFRVSTTGTHPPDNGDTTAPPQPTSPNKATSTQGVPYGTIITNTLGAPNFMLGDYDKDGVVSAADYTVWRKTVGLTGTDTFQRQADGDHNYSVGSSDYTVWSAHFGQPLVSGSAGAGSSSDIASGTVPEPAGWCLAVLALLSATQLKKRPAR